MFKELDRLKSRSSRARSLDIKILSSDFFFQRSNSLPKIVRMSGLSAETKSSLQRFRRCANYIAAAMIFLKDNILLERDIESKDIKPRLLGHWGTCPGLVLVYSHLNLLIRDEGLDMIFVVGPGHGAPAILSSLWLEGSLTKFYPDLTMDKAGLTKLVSGFSTPFGFPSHINALTPGAIHEGGELGYALAVSFGAIMDKPDLIVTCVVGDGEAESGPTATAWHGYKFIDPKESGAVIPIVHLNGFKISERTVYGCMDNEDLLLLFRGYGYQPRVVEDLDNIDDDMHSALTWSVEEIRKIQKAARDGKPISKPRWPMIIMRTPKGWGCPKELDGEKLEGSFHSHQVPLPKVATDAGQLSLLNGWLKEYNVAELFSKEGTVLDDVLEIVPKEGSKKLGQRKEIYEGFEKLEDVDWKQFTVEARSEASSMQTIGKLLDEALVKNPHKLRIFSPDELVSNKLDAVLNHTHRNFQWSEDANDGGRVIEMLSEHTMQGFLQGYTLTGRTGLFPSYEAFLGIIATMIIQYSKFSKLAQETSWRGGIGSINYIETSTWARQEHNGFSHQNPSFIGVVLNIKPRAARVYLPPDANCFLSTLSHCLRSKGYVNLMVGSKQPTPIYLTPEEADAHCKAGASIFKFASTEEGVKPDVVLGGIGTELTLEVVKAAAWLRAHAPDIRVRVVNVTDLMILGKEGSHPHSLSNQGFNDLFTPDKPIIINYHGYPIELKGLLFDRPILDRTTINGYMEEGTTTTPFDMMLLNKVSRYDLAKQAIEAYVNGEKDAATKYAPILDKLADERETIRKNIYATGEDSKDCFSIEDIFQK